MRKDPELWLSVQVARVLQTARSRGYGLQLGEQVSLPGVWKSRRIQLSWGYPRGVLL